LSNFQNENTIRVGVFFGGKSSEKEISLESGRHIYNSLDREKYEVIPIFVDSKLGFWKVDEELLWMNATEDIAKSLKTKAKRFYYEGIKKEIEFAFLGLHGKFVEDGSLQGLLEILEIPYNGPRVLGAAIGMDKIFQKKLLKAVGVKYTPHIVVNEEDIKSPSASLGLIQNVKNELRYPCIVKPSREGCSTGLSKVKNESELIPALKEALKWDREVMVEKFMGEMMEVTCTVLGNGEPYALLPTETPAKGDFLTVEEKFLPGDAQMITPPRVSKEDVKKMQEEFVKAYQAMNLCVYSRIDGWWDTKKKELYINEPNTLPGVTPSTHVFHQAAEADMTPTDFFTKIIDFSLQASKN